MMDTTRISEALFWRRRAERILDQCAQVEQTFAGCLNQRAARALPIWRNAAMDYLALAQKLEKEAISQP